MKDLTDKTLLPRIEQAIKNARACQNSMSGTNSEEYPNPCTTVFELVETLLAIGKNKPYPLQ